MFKYYTTAFKKFKDYSSNATRKEFNFYILNFIILNILLNFGFMIAWLLYVQFNLTTMFEIEAENIQNLYSSTFFVFNLVNYIPFIALTKRRINDIFPTYSIFIFLILLVSGVLINSWEFLILYTQSLAVKYSLTYRIDKIIAIILIICGLINILGNLILMIKNTKNQLESTNK